VIQMLIFDLRHRLATLEESQGSQMMPLCFVKELVMTSFLLRQSVNIFSLSVFLITTISACSTVDKLC